MFAGAATDGSWANVAHVKSARGALDFQPPEQVKHHT